MATDDGIHSMKAIRRMADTLWERRHYLLDKIDSKRRADRGVSFEEDEVRAIEFALGLIETEWDNHARLNRNLQAVKQHLHSAERQEVDLARVTSPEWETADAG